MGFAASAFDLELSRVDAIGACLSFPAAVVVYIALRRLAVHLVAEVVMAADLKRPLEWDARRGLVLENKLALTADCDPEFVLGEFHAACVAWLSFNA